MLLVAAMVPGFALAQETTAEELAVRANDVHQTWCADIYGAEVSAAAAGYREVADVWADLDVQLAETPDAALIYWRGVLAQCLGQDERAAVDLRAFLDLVEQGGGEDDGDLSAMEGDALKRIARIERQRNRARWFAEASPSRRRRTGGAVVLSAGATAAAIGFAVNVGVYNRYIGTNDFATYNWAAGVSQAGLAVGLVGALTGVVGVVLVALPVDDSSPGVARVSVGIGPRTWLEVSF